jgi:hypothetical protein
MKNLMQARYLALSLLAAGIAVPALAQQASAQLSSAAGGCRGKKPATPACGVVVCETGDGPPGSGVWDILPVRLEKRADREQGSATAATRIVSAPMARQGMCIRTLSPLH